MGKSSLSGPSLNVRAYGSQANYTIILNGYHNAAHDNPRLTRSNDSIQNLASIRSKTQINIDYLGWRVIEISLSIP